MRLYSDGGEALTYPTQAYTHSGKQMNCLLLAAETILFPSPAGNPEETEVHERQSFVNRARAADLFWDAHGSQSWLVKITQKDSL